MMVWNVLVKWINLQQMLIFMLFQVDKTVIDTPELGLANCIGEF